MTKLSNHCWVGCLKFRGQFGEEDGEEWCANEWETACEQEEPNQEFKDST